MGRGDFMLLLGGLALFLHGMEAMASGLSAAGEGLRRFLGRFAGGRFAGLLLGALATAVIQSSSAVTVMAVGFVDSGVLTLRQAVYIIMGANVGTTVTGGLTALNVGELAPLLAFLGVAAAFAGRQRFRRAGDALAGLGILFIGMEMMGAGLRPLGKSAAFVRLMAEFENPLLGILAGAAFTAAVQSSSASVGILQALAAGGAAPLSGAVFVIFGQNIGTCATAAIASVGMGRNAKRAALAHFLFNVVGTAVFSFLSLYTPLVSAVACLLPGNPAAQVAAVHALFNAGTAFLLLPFGGRLAALTERLLPEKGEGRIDVSVKSKSEKH